MIFFFNNINHVLFIISLLTHDFAEFFFNYTYYLNINSNVFYLFNVIVQFKIIIKKIIIIKLNFMLFAFFLSII